MSIELAPPDRHLWSTVPLSFGESARTACEHTVGYNTGLINTVWLYPVPRSADSGRSSVLRPCLEKLLGKRSRYWLARQTGISEGNLRRFARGQTSSIKFDNLEKICRALGCTPGDMLVLTDDDQAPGATKKKGGLQKKSSASQPP